MAEGSCWTRVINSRHDAGVPWEYTLSTRSSFVGAIAMHKVLAGGLTWLAAGVDGQDREADRKRELYSGQGWVSSRKLLWLASSELESELKSVNCKGFAADP